MQTPHHRKIELQSPADLSYLYTNTLATSRQKLDLHFPPSANNDTNDPDPMKERVRELVDEFITKTFTTSIPSISINGLDDDDNTSTTNPESLLSATTNETIEYEPYDAKLASRVSSLYAQLESLTTTVAQLRRDAPAKAARGYAEVLMGGLDDELDDEEEEEGVDEEGGWGIKVPEMEGGASGEMEDVYEEAVRTLLRLQGEGGAGKVGSEEGGGEEDSSGSGGGGSTGLATTVGKIERAGRAAEVVEKM